REDLPMRVRWRPVRRRLLPPCADSSVESEEEVEPARERDPLRGAGVGLERLEVEVEPVERGVVRDLTREREAARRQREGDGEERRDEQRPSLPGRDRGLGE